MIRGLCKAVLFLTVAWLPGACKIAEKSAPPVPDFERLIVPAFELEDQEGRLHTYGGRSDLPVVILISSREGVDSNIQWDHWLMNLYEDRITIYRVLDLSEMPAILAPIVRSKVRENSDPPGIPVLMDWEGRFASLLPLSDEASTVLVVDRDGKAALVARGTPNGALQQKIAAELARLGIDAHGG